ncbi:MAG: hypothetical protein KDA44_05270 [Planctomycetales bacterium]|nr:hypothetical protein [Planctomycetales bacterium]
MPRSTWSTRRTGFSLVEVVASVLLVGTLLTAVLTAHRRAAGQYRTAERRLQAITALDGLLEARASGVNGELSLARGKVPGDPRLQWRSTLRDEPGLTPWGAAVLRIEVFDPALRGGETLAFVELIEPSGGRDEGWP